MKKRIDNASEKIPAWVIRAITDKLGCTYPGVALILNGMRGTNKTKLQKKVWSLYEKYMSVSLENN